MKSTLYEENIWNNNNNIRINVRLLAQRNYNTTKPSPPIRTTIRQLYPHHITSHHITSRHVTSRHVTSRDITSRHVTSHHITSHHITSHHITSHHITSHHILTNNFPMTSPIVLHTVASRSWKLVDSKIFTNTKILFEFLVFYSPAH